MYVNPMSVYADPMLMCDNCMLSYVYHMLMYANVKIKLINTNSVHVCKSNVKIC